MGYHTQIIRPVLTMWKKRGLTFTEQRKNIEMRTLRDCIRNSVIRGNLKI